MRRIELQHRRFLGRSFSILRRDNALALLEKYKLPISSPASPSDNVITLDVDRQSCLPRIKVKTTSTESEWHLRYSQSIPSSIAGDIAKVVNKGDVADGARVEQFLNNLWKLFKDRDAIEVAAGVSLVDGILSCTGAKISLDPAAAKRQPELSPSDKENKLTDSEQKAEKLGLVYMELDGDIGCVVNGAGLAM